MINHADYINVAHYSRGKYEITVTHGPNKCRFYSNPTEKSLYRIQKFLREHHVGIHLIPYPDMWCFVEKEEEEQEDN